MNLKGNLTSKGLQGSIGKSRMQGILGTNPAAIPISVDNALSLSSTNPVQNRVITAAITNRLWSDEVKAALLQIVEKVAFIDEDGQDYYDALYDALYPPTNLDSIGAVFDSSATIYNTDTLDDLKQYLTVTAYYTDGTSETVTTYTLSGTLTAGTSTITVLYSDKTTTFTVVVTSEIPTNYTKLAYLKANGTQYINTGFGYSNTDSYELVAKDFTSVKSSTQWYLGAYTGSQIIGLNSATGSTYGNGSRVYVRWGDPEASINVNHMYFEPNPSSKEYTILQDKRKAYVDGTLIATSDARTFTISIPIYLFARNNKGTADNKSTFAIKAFKILDGDGAVKAHFIPCLDDNSTPCMFEKISRETKYNAGTGTFLYEEVSA